MTNELEWSESELGDVEHVQTDDGVSIAFRATGHGPGTIVMLHGWGGAGSGGSWGRLLPCLNLTGWRVLAVDLRGHGKSDKPDQTYTLDRWARDVLAVADHAGAHRFALVGASMGGRLALWLACHYRSRVRGQFLIAPVPADPLPLDDDMVESWIRNTRSLDAWMVFLGQFSVKPMPAEVAEAFFADVSRASEWARRESLKLCSRDDFADLLCETRVPTLVLAGQHDGMLPPDLLAGKITGRIPDARLVSVDAGHEIARENPQVVAELLQEFLTTLPD